MNIENYKLLATGATGQWAYSIVSELAPASIGNIHWTVFGVVLAVDVIGIGGQASKWHGVIPENGELHC